MTDPTDPDLWWQSLDPERRRVWVRLVAGMTMTEIIAEAYRRATGENVPLREPIRVADDNPAAPQNPPNETTDG